MVHRLTHRHPIHHRRPGSADLCPAAHEKRALRPTPASAPRDAQPATLASVDHVRTDGLLESKEGTVCGQRRVVDVACRELRSLLSVVLRVPDHLFQVKEHTRQDELIILRNRPGLAGSVGAVHCH